MTNITANHYDQNGFETRDLIDKITNHLDMHLTPSQHQDVFNIVKYISRAGKKGDWRSDAYKAADYLCHLLKGEYLHFFPTWKGEEKTCGECLNNDDQWCNDCSRNYADLFNDENVPTYEQKTSEHTCKVDGIEQGDPWTVYEVDLSCGHTFYVTNPDNVKYCEVCGAKVVA